MALNRDYVNGLRTRLATFREQQKEVIADATAVIEIWGASFAAGWLHGRKGLMPTLFGVPYDALAAVACYVVAFGGMAKGAKAHVMNLGHGFGAYYAGNLGAQLGQRMRKETPEWKGTAWTEEEAKKLGGQVRNIVGGYDPRMLNAYNANAQPGARQAHAAGWY